MSLIPPAPIVLSKMKYHIISKHKDRSPEELNHCLDVLGPFPDFRVDARFRSLITGETNIFTDLDDLTPFTTDKTDCVDTMLLMMNKVKTKMIDTIKDPGVLRVSLTYNIDSTIPLEDKKWYDLFLDERPINVPGLVTGDEDENELSKKIEEL